MVSSEHGSAPPLVARPASSRGGNAGLVIIALVAVTLALGLGVGGGLLLAPTPAPAVTTVVESGPPVVVAVRDLARLESAEFRMERVIDLRDKKERFMGLVETEDGILLVAAARVSAGVDLRELDDDDIDVDRERRAVTVRLPEPEIFEASLDNERTYVHSRDTDLLAERVDNLETRARQAAEKSLREAALEAGILDLAKANAERTIRSLLKSLGFETITIEHS